MLPATGKNITGYGVEFGHDNITACIEKGVNVIEKNIDEGLAGIEDNSFDTVIMTQALQVMHRPDQIVDEMLRIGKECIVTFPNFGHWRARDIWRYAGKCQSQIPALYLVQHTQYPFLYL